MTLRPRAARAELSGAALPLVEEGMLAETSNGVIARLKAVLTQVSSKENDICDHPSANVTRFPF